MCKVDAYSPLSFMFTRSFVLLFAFMCYDLHLLSAGLAASMHPIVFVLSSVPLSPAFLAIDWCKHFGASVLGSYSA